MEVICEGCAEIKYFERVPLQHEILSAALSIASAASD